MSRKTPMDDLERPQTNAAWHATGKRVRDLPITLDKLFQAPTPW